MCGNVVFWPGWTATCRTGSWMDNFRIREQMNHKSSFMYIYVIRSSLAEFLACGISSRSLLPSIPMSCVAGWSCPFRPFIMRFSDAVEKQLHLHILHSTRPLLGFFLNLFFMAEIGVVGLDHRKDQFHFGADRLVFATGWTNLRMAGMGLVPRASHEDRKKIMSWHSNQLQLVLRFNNDKGKQGHQHAMMGHDGPWWAMMGHDGPWWAMMCHDDMASVQGFCRGSAFF